MRPAELGFKPVQKNLWRKPTDSGYIHLSRKWDDGEEVYTWTIGEFDNAHNRIDKIADDWAYENEHEQVPQKIIKQCEALMSEEVEMSGDKYLKMLTEDKSAWNVDIDGTTLHDGERVEIVGPVFHVGEKGRIVELLNGFCVVKIDSSDTFKYEGKRDFSFHCSNVRKIADQEDIDDEDEETLTEATVEQSDAFWEISEELGDEVMPDEIEQIWKGCIKGLSVEDIMASVEDPTLTNKDVLNVQDKLREKGLLTEAKTVAEPVDDPVLKMKIDASFANDEDGGGGWGEPEYLDVEEFFEELKKRGILSNVSKNKILRDKEEIEFEMILTGKKSALESFMNEYFIPEDERDSAGPFAIGKKDFAHWYDLVEALDLTTVDFSDDIAKVKSYFASTPEKRDGFRFDPNSGVAIVKTEEQHASFPPDVKAAIKNLVTKGVDVRFSMFEKKNRRVVKEAKEDIEFKTDEKAFKVSIEKTSVGSFFFIADTRNAGEAVGRVLRDESVEFVPYKKNGKFELHLNVQDFNRDQDVRKLITKLKKRATEWLIAIESGENIKKVADEAESIGNPGDIKKSLDSAVKSTKVKIDFVWPEGTVKPKPDMEEDEAPAADEKEKIDDLKDELKESSVVMTTNIDTVFESEKDIENFMRRLQKYNIKTKKRPTTSTSRLDIFGLRSSLLRFLKSWHGADGSGGYTEGDIVDMYPELKESNRKKKSNVLKEDIGESFVVIEPIVDLMKGIEEKAKKHGVVFDPMGGDQSAKWKVFGKVTALESFLMDALSKSREEARQMIMDSGALHEARDERGEFIRRQKDNHDRMLSWIQDLEKNYWQTDFGYTDVIEEFGEDVADDMIDSVVAAGSIRELPAVNNERQFEIVADDLSEDATDIGAPTAEDVKKAKQATGV